MQTEERLGRFDHQRTTFKPNSLLNVDWNSRSEEERTVLIENLEAASRVLSVSTPETCRQYFSIAKLHRAEDRMFHIFEALLEKVEVPIDAVLECMDEHPPLAYCVLKKFLVSEVPVADDLRTAMTVPVIRQIIRSANELGIAALAALERLVQDIADMNLSTYLDILWVACLSVRSAELVQEILLVLHDSRGSYEEATHFLQYAHKHSLGVAFDRAEEAANECPCDDKGRPQRQKEAPVVAKLCVVPPPKSKGAEANQPVAEPPQSDSDIPTRVLANVRVDLKVPIRIHSHVRLRVASTAEHSTLPADIVDAIVVRSSRGELELEALHPLPPEWSTVDWYLYQAGSVVTSKAMMDAIRRLVLEGDECCGFSDLIVGMGSGHDAALEDQDAVSEEANEQFTVNLNESQRRAVLSTKLGFMNLIWGPPGMSTSRI